MSVANPDLSLLGLILTLALTRLFSMNIVLNNNTPAHPSLTPAGHVRLGRRRGALQQDALQREEAEAEGLAVSLREEELRCWVQQNKHVRSAARLSRAWAKVGVASAVALWAQRVAKTRVVQGEVRAFLRGMPADMSRYTDMLLREGFDTLEAVSLVEVEELRGLGVALGHSKLLHAGAESLKPVLGARLKASLEEALAQAGVTRPRTTRAPSSAS